METLQASCHPSSKKKRGITRATTTTTTIMTTDSATEPKSGSSTDTAAPAVREYPSPSSSSTTPSSLRPPPPSSKVTTTSTKKHANRYDPVEPLAGPEDYTAWRRDARKKRNRESAQISRNKVRNRIQELETQVEDYKGKYLAALERIRLTTEEHNRRQAPSRPSVDDVQRYSVVSPNPSPNTEDIGSLSSPPSTVADGAIESSLSMTMRTVSTAPVFPSLVELGPSTATTTTAPPSSSTCEDDLESSFATMRYTSTAPLLPLLVDLGPPPLTTTAAGKKVAVLRVVHGVARIEVVTLDEHQNVIETTPRPA